MIREGWLIEGWGGSTARETDNGFIRDGGSGCVEGWGGIG